MLPARWSVKYFIFLKFKMRDSSSEIMHVIGTCTHNFFLLPTREIILLNIHMHSAKKWISTEAIFIVLQIYFILLAASHRISSSLKYSFVVYCKKYFCNKMKFLSYSISLDGENIEIDKLCLIKRYRKLLAIQPSLIFMRESSSSLYCSLSKDINFN